MKRLTKNQVDYVRGRITELLRRIQALQIAALGYVEKPRGYTHAEKLRMILARKAKLKPADTEFDSRTVLTELYTYPRNREHEANERAFREFAEARRKILEDIAKRESQILDALILGSETDAYAAISSAEKELQRLLIPLPTPPAAPAAPRALRTARTTNPDQGNLL